MNAAYRDVGIGVGQILSDRRGVSETDIEHAKGRFRVLAYVRYHRELLRYDRRAKEGMLCTPKAIVTPDRVYEANLRTGRRVRDRPGVAGGDCRNSGVFDRFHRVAHDPEDTYTRDEAPSRRPRFHSAGALIALAMLSLTGLCPPLPR
jgi:hypothetical protein